jgi:nitrite reductase/ring-hydroxylating ferredoxin subunit
LKLYASNSAIVGRDAQGFFAMSALCTHEQAPLDFREPTACTVPVDCTAISMAGNTRCPRHFSRFDGNGAATQPPATVSLPHYQVTVAGGEITVSPAAVIAATVRSMGS